MIDILGQTLAQLAVSAVIVVTVGLVAAVILGGSLRHTDGIGEDDE